MTPRDHDIELFSAPVEQTPITTLTSEDKARSRGTRIGVVVACVVGGIVSPKLMINISLGTFLIPISHDFQWPRERISGVLTLLAVVSALTYPIVGRLADQFGPRRMILVGILGAGLSVFALGFLQPNIFLFYGLFGLIGMFGSLSSTMIYNQVIARTFDRTRGTMLGVTSGLGNGLGAVIVPFAVLFLMRASNWRGAFIGLGVIVLVIGFPTILSLLKDPPRPARMQDSPADDLAGMTLMQAARTSSFWLTAVAVCLGAGCLLAVQAHIVPILSDRGFPVSQGTLVVSVFAIAGACWMPVAGWILDWIGSPKIIAPLYLLSAAGALALEHGTTLPLLATGGAIMGIGSATEFAALSYFTSRYFGLRCFGIITGVMYSAATIAQGVTPYLMDVDFDHHKSYLLSLHIIEVALVAGALLIACLPQYSANVALWRKTPIYP